MPEGQNKEMVELLIRIWDIKEILQEMKEAVRELSRGLETIARVLSTK